MPGQRVFLGEGLESGVQSMARFNEELTYFKVLKRAEKSPQG